MRKPYRLLQDRFNEEIGKKYGLERGERRPDRKHIEQLNYTAEKLKAENEELERTNEAYIEHNEVLQKAAETYENTLNGDKNYVELLISNARLELELQENQRMSDKKNCSFEKIVEKSQ